MRRWSKEGTPLQFPFKKPIKKQGNQASRAQPLALMRQPLALMRQFAFK